MKILHLGDFLYDYQVTMDDIEELGGFFKKNKIITVLNLEAPLKRGAPIKKWINLYQSDLIIDILNTLNVKAVNLANNHIMDWGSEGLLELIEALDQSNIIYFGAGVNLESARSPKYMDVYGKRIGLVGFGWKEEMCVYAKKDKPGVAPLNPVEIINQVKRAKSMSDIVVVHLHWGYEYELYPLPVHRELAHEIIDSGADLIIGHHPHIVQAFETYNDKHIYYSLGNFYFGSRRELFRTSKSLIAREKSSYGLGVVQDFSSNNIELIYFAYEDGMTRIASEFMLHNISDIPKEGYNQFFKKNRTSNRKPSLYVSNVGYLVNPIKLKLNRVKLNTIKNTSKILRKIGLYRIVKRVFFKQR